MQNINDLVIPQDFINHYYEELKNELNSSDLQISKVGAIGYLLHVLGNLQYDIKNYYNYLSNEAYPISAVDNSNLIQHASLYGFNYDLAKTSSLNGTIKFKLDNLIAFSTSIVKREIFIDNISLEIDSMNYILDSQYVITMIRNNNISNWHVQTIDSQGRKYINSINFSNAYASIIDLNQYTIIREIYTIPLYKFGSFYQIKIPIPSEQDISSIEVRVTEVTNTVTDINVAAEDFEVKSIKNFSESNDTHVFYRIYESAEGKILLIELGSGVQGKYIPKSTVDITIKTTFGEKGNIGNYLISSAINGKVSIIDYDSDNNSTTLQVSTDNFLSFDIAYGSGGVNVLKHEQLRTALLRYIQNRSNLISEMDYNEIISQYFKYYSVLFKKTSLHENTIYIYVDLLDKYSQPVYINSECVDYYDFVGRNNSNVHSVITNNTTIDEYIPYPLVKLANKLFICPFLFKKRNNLKSFSGLLVKENFFQYYTSIIENDLLSIIKLINDKVITISYTKILPLVYLEIKVDIGTENGVSYCRTIFNAKSTDSLNDYTFIINIPTIGILSDMADGSDETFKTLTYNGLITEPFIATINVLDNVPYQIENSTTNLIERINVFDLKFENVHYILNVEDILRLKILNYKPIDKVNPTLNNSNYLVVSIPLIDKEAYDKNKEYLINKLFSKLQQSKISNLRMVTDDPQIRFLNSFYIHREYLSKLCPLKNNINEVYNFDIFFPLKVKIDLSFDKQYVLLNKLDVLAEINKIKYEISKLLNNTKTGTEFYFYKSMLSDILHNFDSIRGGNIYITDSRSKFVDKIFYENDDQANNIFIRPPITANIKVNVVDKFPITTIDYGSINKIKYGFIYDNTTIITEINYTFEGFIKQIGDNATSSIIITINSKSFPIITKEIILSSNWTYFSVPFKLNEKDLSIPVKNNLDFYIQIEYKSAVNNTLHIMQPDVKNGKTSSNIELNENGDAIIPNGNLVIIDQDSMVDEFTKLENLKYCPTLFWWDINNIEINSQVV